MGKQVPFVLYKDGHRVILGAASVQDNGHVEAQVHKDKVQELKALGLFDGTYEFSISAVGFPPSNLVTNPVVTKVTTTKIVSR